MHDPLTNLLAQTHLLKAALAVLKWTYDSDQPRDEHGRWVAGAGDDDDDSKPDASGRRGGPRAQGGQSNYERIGNWLRDNLGNLFPYPTTGSGPVGVAAQIPTAGQGGAPMHGAQTRLSYLWEQGVNNLTLRPAQRSQRLTELATYMYDLALSELYPNNTVATPSGDIQRPEIPSWMTRYVGPGVTPSSNEGRQLPFFRQNVEKIKEAIRNNGGALNRTNWIRVIRAAVRHANVNARMVGRRDPRAPDPDAR